MLDIDGDFKHFPNHYQGFSIARTSEAFCKGSGKLIVAAPLVVEGEAPTAPDFEKLISEAMNEGDGGYRGEGYRKLLAATSRLTSENAWLTGERDDWALQTIDDDEMIRSLRARLEAAMRFNDRLVEWESEGTIYPFPHDALADFRFSITSTGGDKP